MKLLTINLWRYYDFEKRLPNIIQIIHEKKPDIIFFQEVQTDRTKSPFSQIEIIKNKLNGFLKGERFEGEFDDEYPFSIHSTILKKEFQRGSSLEKPVQHGMGVISKYPIIHSEEFYLNLSSDEKEDRSVLFFDVLDNEKNRHKLVNIHFGNREKWARKQVFEVMNILQERDEKRIFAGDFNLFQASEFMEKKPGIFENYKLSFDFKKYYSITHGFENGKEIEKKGVLDYFLIPEKYSYINFEGIDAYVSDHKALFCEIQKR